MQIVFLGDNLHEMSKPIFGKSKNNIVSLSSVKFTQRLAKVNLPGAIFPFNYSSSVILFIKILRLAVLDIIHV